MSNDYFAQKAGNYEQDKKRVANVETIASAILNRIDVDQSMEIMDFGSGTGLLLEQVAPHVSKITSIDISASMNKQLSEKREALGCELEMLEMDLSTTPLERTFDGIISSMTMHHIQDIPAMLVRFYSMLNKDGFIALADLDKEDGSFHSEDTGVFHFGFDRDEFAKYASDAGFKSVNIELASTINKPHGQFPVFLLTAYK